MRRATNPLKLAQTSLIISIHALLAESDDTSLTRIIGFLGFLSTLSLRRATCQWRRSVKLFKQFLSTLSLRRATPVSELRVTSNVHFYPRSPCGERPDGRTDPRGGRFISIHALLAESDLDAAQAMLVHDPMSIHALLAESDTIFAVRPYDAPIFLSTLSLRRATIWSH